nr:collagen alpha-1(I) chain [Desmodus rotundus]
MCKREHTIHSRGRGSCGAQWGSGVEHSGGALPKAGWDWRPPGPQGAQGSRANWADSAGPAWEGLKGGAYPVAPPPHSSASVFLGPVPGRALPRATQHLLVLSGPPHGGWGSQLWVSGHLQAHLRPRENRAPAVMSWRGPFPEPGSGGCPEEGGGRKLPPSTIRASGARGGHPTWPEQGSRSAKRPEENSSHHPLPSRGLKLDPIAEPPTFLSRGRKWKEEPAREPGTRCVHHLPSRWEEGWRGEGWPAPQSSESRRGRCCRVPASLPRGEAGPGLSRRGPGPFLSEGGPRHPPPGTPHRARPRQDCGTRQRRRPRPV